jgi:hypothetical protein
MTDGNRRRFELAAAGLGAFFIGRALLGRLGRYELRDKVVLITGGSRGLGLVIARRLAAEGARLAICARDEAELERAHDELPAPGGADHAGVPGRESESPISPSLFTRLGDRAARRNNEMQARF